MSENYIEMSGSMVKITLKSGKVLEFTPEEWTELSGLFAAPPQYIPVPSPGIPYITPYYPLTPGPTPQYPPWMPIITCQGS